MCARSMVAHQRLQCSFEQRHQQRWGHSSAATARGRPGCLTAQLGRCGRRGSRLVRGSARRVLDDVVVPAPRTRARAREAHPCVPLFQSPRKFEGWPLSLSISACVVYCFYLLVVQTAACTNLHVFVRVLAGPPLFTPPPPMQAPACMKVCLSVRLSVGPSIRLSVRLSVCLSVCLSICLSLSVFLSSFT